MKKLAETLFVPSLLFMLFYSSPMWAQQSSFTIDYEKYILDNGLEVILHKDTSDPIVAVATLVHVGSNREKPGRTGFAHFFEHMSFNDSENAPRGANRKMIPELEEELPVQKLAVPWGVLFIGQLIEMIHLGQGFSGHLPAAQGRNPDPLLLQGSALSLDVLALA